jgi:hypothetical protein
MANMWAELADQPRVDALNHTSRSSAPFGDAAGLRSYASLISRPPEPPLVSESYSLIDVRTGMRNRAIAGYQRPAGCGSLGWKDRGVSSGAAICGREHLVLSTLDRTTPLIAVRTKHPKTEGGSFCARIAFRAGRARRTYITTATHQWCGQCNADEQPQKIH